MLKILVKKQMTEIFRNYIYDAKKNTARSKGSTIVLTLFFILLMVGFVGGMFTLFAVMLCSQMAQAGAAWLYFAVMGLASIVLGSFGSVFNTFSTLYLPKDNDLLLSMPIPVGKLMASRLLSVFLMGLMYSGVVLLPATAVYWVTVSASVGAIVGGLLYFLLISVFVLTLSCGLGWVVAKISVKLKHKSFITVIVSLLFFAAYYFFYYKAQTLIGDLLKNVAEYSEKIKASAYPMYVFGKAGTGDAVSLLLMAAAVALLFAVMWFLISRSFLKIATATGDTVGRKYREKSVKQKSVSNALLRKEFARFTSSPNYMLNCGLGTVFMLIVAVMTAVRGGAFLTALEAVLSVDRGSILVLVCAALCALGAMNDTVAPSVSLEGKSIWVAQSIPVKPWSVLLAKLRLQLILTLPVLLVCIVCVAFVFPAKAAELMLATLMCVAFVLLATLFGLFIGLKKAMLTWTSEIMPIKQGAPGLLTLLASFVYSVAYGAVYFIKDIGKMGFVPYTAVWLGATVLLCSVLYLWLKKKGSRVFAEL